MYSIREGNLTSTLGSAAEKDGTCRLRVSGDGNTLAWWISSMIHTWNLADNRANNAFDAGSVFAFYEFQVVLSRDGSSLAVTTLINGNSLAVRLWDTKTGSLITILPGDIVGYSRSSDLLAAVVHVSIPNSRGCSEPISIWRLSDHKFIRQLFGSEGYSTIAFNPAGTQLAASFSGFGCGFFGQQIQKRFIKIWNLDTGEILGEHVAAINESAILMRATDYQIQSFYNLTFSPDNRIAGVGFDNDQYGDNLPNKIFLWDKFGEAPDQPIQRRELNTASFSLNGLYVDLGKLDPSGRYFYPEIVSPDSKYEMSFNSNKSAYELKNKQDGSLIHDFGIWAIGAFSPRSDLLAVFRHDRMWMEIDWLEVWDLQNSKSLQSIQFEAGNPQYLQFSPDGKFLISVSSDQTVRIWGVMK